MHRAAHTAAQRNSWLSASPDAALHYAREWQARGSAAAVARAALVTTSRIVKLQALCPSYPVEAYVALADSVRADEQQLDARCVAPRHETMHAAAMSALVTLAPAYGL